MTNRVLVAILVGVLCLASFLGGNTTSGSANSLSIDPAVSSAQPPAFTVCPGTFALCTSAKCTPTGLGLTATCLCDVQQGFSAGKRPCSEVFRVN